VFSFLSRARFISCGSLLLLATAVLPAQQSGSTLAAPALDYQFFKERVQPIFLKKRPGHARCITCHQRGSPPLQPLDPGATHWNEEQSRKNFAIWSLFVVPGQPMKSKMLLHPLAKEAGGDHFHAGGRHWKSQSDPEWQILAAWVNGQTKGGSK
jgi:hypothetical protein